MKFQMSNGPRRTAILEAVETLGYPIVHRDEQNFEVTVPSAIAAHQFGSLTGDYVLALLKGG